MKKNTKSCIIIGAGISGLCTAYWLEKEGFEVTVLEQDDEVGGTMKTERKHGFLIDTGPNSALETTPLFEILFDELGILHERIYANEAAQKRYILRDGILHPIPMSPGLFIRSKLWSTKGKLRLLKEPFVGKVGNEESIADFVTRRLGREFLDYAINPFVAGVYAGNPEELSVRAAFPKLYRLEEVYGGLIKGLIKGRKERKERAEKSKQSAKMFSFLNGMSTFPNALAKALKGKVYLNTTVTGVEQKKNMYVVKVKSASRKNQFKAEHLVFAIPSFRSASMLKKFDSSFADLLNGIYYPPVALVFNGYRAEQVSHPLDGFGYLIPAVEKRKILGTIWSSAIFPDRAPDGSVAFTTFVGGSRQPEIARLKSNELNTIVQKELSSILGIKGKPEYTYSKKWDRAIPQYRMGYQKVQHEIELFEKNHPGIHLASNFKNGIAVGDCVMTARKTADSILQQSV